jgi:hypothetical protein
MAVVVPLVVEIECGNFPMMMQWDTFSYVATSKMF